MPSFGKYDQVQLSRGSHAAYARFYNIYSGGASDYLLRITKDPVVAEELTQEVFIKLWMKHERLAFVQDLKGYILIVCRNTAITYIARYQRKKRLEANFASQQDWAYFPAPNLQELDKKYQAAVKLLPPQQRKVFILKMEHGLQRCEIAKELSISPFTVKATMQHALRAVRQRMTA